MISTNQQTEPIKQPHSVQLPPITSFDHILSTIPPPQPAFAPQKLHPFRTISKTEKAVEHIMSQAPSYLPVPAFEQPKPPTIDFLSANLHELMSLSAELNQYAGMGLDGWQRYHLQPNRDNLSFMEAKSKRMVQILESLRAPYVQEQPLLTPNSLNMMSQPDSSSLDVIRNKRVRTSGQKRKNSSNVDQRCHSCNATETPEWRRGPDGARTLCNACGLHYAKLLKKPKTSLDLISKKPDSNRNSAINLLSMAAHSSMENLKQNSDPTNIVFLKK